MAEPSMMWVDWAILIVMVLSVLGGLSQGFFLLLLAGGPDSWPGAGVMELPDCRSSAAASSAQR